MTGTPAPPISGRRYFIAAIGLAALLAAGSLLCVGEATSRDTNNWLIWARQLSLGHSLDFTGGVPSWKPLPVLVSLPFARASASLSNLTWLWMVRFSWLMCSVLLAGLVVPRFGKFAGAVAAVLPLALPAWFAYALMGDSEPVAAALALGALLLVRVERLRWATALLIAAGLLRPELWALLLVLLGWQWRRDRRGAYIGLVISAVVLLIGWSLVPALTGGGWAQAANRASTRLLVGNQADGFFTLLPLRAWLLVVVGAIGVWQKRDKTLAILGVATFGLAAEVEAMSWFGFSGLDRYVMPGAIALCALAGAGAATLVDLSPVSWGRWLIGVAVAVVVSGLVWTAVPLDRDNIRERRAEGLSAQRAVTAFNKAGGTEKFRGCLPLATNGSWSVILGRMLGLPLRDVTNYKSAPAVVLRPTQLANYKNGPAIDAHGIKPMIVSYERPDWVVLLYSGCETNGHR